jgi:hypothetical protein
MYCNEFEGRIWLLIVYAKAKLIIFPLNFWQNLNKSGKMTKPIDKLVDTEVQQLRNNLLLSMR